MEKKKILIIDDDTLCRKAVTNFAKKLNIDADEAESGEKGVELVSSNSYAVIMIDLFMPGLNGYETAKKMSEASKGQLGPLIIMSGDEVTNEEYEPHGFKSFIQKPVSKKAFEKIAAEYKLV